MSVLQVFKSLPVAHDVAREQRAAGLGVGLRARHRSRSAGRTAEGARRGGARTAGSSSARRCRAGPCSRRRLLVCDAARARVRGDPSVTSRCSSSSRGRRASGGSSRTTSATATSRVMIDRPTRSSAPTARAWSRCWSSTRSRSRGTRARSRRVGLLADHPASDVAHERSIRCSSCCTSATACFPIGAFAHSDGLEAAASSGRSPTPTTCRAWMDALLHETPGVRRRSRACCLAWDALRRAALARACGARR